jgi:hypothetical protein
MDTAKIAAPCFLCKAILPRPLMMTAIKIDDPGRDNDPHADTIRQHS